MRHIGVTIFAGYIALASAGCRTSLIDDTDIIAPETSAPMDGAPVIPNSSDVLQLEANPVYVPWGPDYYSVVFEKALQTLSDNEFEFLETNRYDGRIETRPRVIPGLGLFWRPGAATFYDRLLATFQSHRHRISVIIRPADKGGYFVEFIARKELEDLPRPLQSTVGAAIFRQENSIERQYEVIDPTMFDANWMFRGRDTAFEQQLIRSFLDALHCPP